MPVIASCARSCRSTQIQYSASAIAGWSSSLRAVTDASNESTSSAVARADSRPSAPSAHRREIKASAARASSPSSRASASAVCECATTSSSRSINHRRHDATPSWPPARSSRSPSACSRTSKKREAASLGATYVRIRASAFSTRARLPTRRQLLQKVSQPCLRPRRIARLEVEIRGVDGAADRVGGISGGSQLARAVEEQSGRSGCAASPCMHRSSLEGRRNRLVRLVHRRRKLPCARLGIGEQAREPRVDGTATQRRCSLERAGSEQRMCEPDSRAVELDDARLESGCEPDARRDLLTQPR